MLFGEYLVKRRLVSPEQVQQALAQQPTTVNTRMGEVAQEAHKLSPAQVDDVLARQRQSQKRFGEIAVEQAYLSDEEMFHLLWQQGSQRKPIGELLLEMGAIKLDNESTNSVKALFLSRITRQTGVGDGDFEELHDEASNGSFKFRIAPCQVCTDYTPLPIGHRTQRVVAGLVGQNNVLLVGYPIGLTFSPNR